MNTIGTLEQFWHGRRVLLTGHTGFKGAWLSVWLAGLGAEVTGYALAPSGEPNLWSILAAADAAKARRSIIADIRDVQRLGEAVAQADPQIVIHMAAQALVRESYRDPLGTYATNVMGTAALLQACRSLRHLECVVIVTSDKVYENRGEGRPFDEGDRLGGHDPYSNSKACAELVTASFRDSFFADGPPIATARAGNVIGGGDWSEERLIPDCVRALDAGRARGLALSRCRAAVAARARTAVGLPGPGAGSGQAPEASAARCQFRPRPGILLHGARGRGRVQARVSRANPAGSRDPAPQPAEAQALTLSSALAGHALGLASAARHARIDWRGPRTGTWPIRRERTWRHFPRRRSRGIGIDATIRA